MSSLAPALGVKIPIPAELAVAVIVIVVVIIAIALAGSAMQGMRTTRPRGTRIASGIVATGLTGLAIYLLTTVMLQRAETDYGDVVQNATVVGALVGGLALAATVLWRFADHRAIAAITGGALGAALVAKPIAWPLQYDLYQVGMVTRSLADTEHLLFLIPGVVALITGLVVARR